MKRLIIILFCFALLGCKKESVTQRPEFIGYWYCDFNQDFKYSISIDEDGNAVYQEHNMEGGGDGASIQGKARADDKKLKIGSLHHFTITEYPQQIDTTGSVIWTLTKNGSTAKKANWKMTLKGPNFYLGDGTYYKADY